MADEHGSRFRLPWSGLAQRVARREAQPAPSGWRARLRSRLAICAVFFALWTAGIEARLLYLQVFQHAEMMARANRQQLRTIKLPAKRGEIVDRAGHVLAYSVDADTIAADPTEVGDPDQVAAAVCGALDACTPQQRATMAERLRSKLQFVYLARQISGDEAHRVRALDLSGLLYYKENRRYYPNKELAAHVLGYVGLDNGGLAGLESTFDARIRGSEGKMLVQTDARRHAMSTREERPPTAGDGLELTIDEYLQYVADRELRAGVAENAAAGGTAIVMEPRSGEILALANWPTFNPNAFLAADETARRNRAIQDLYEPGSTFKIVTASAAVEERLIGPDDPIDCSPGYITFGPRTIRDTHEYGVLPFIDVIAKSSNVGAIKVGMKLGPERLMRYVNRFGFGQTIAPDFRGENPGIVWDASQTGRERARLGVDGISGRRDADSDGDRGQRRRERRGARRAARRPRVHPERAPRGGAPEGRAARDQSGDRRDADRESWKPSSSAAPRRASRKWRVHGRRQDRHRLEAREPALLEVRLQRVVRRLRPVAQSGGGRSSSSSTRRTRRATTAPSCRRPCSNGSPMPPCGTSASDRTSTPRRR